MIRTKIKTIFVEDFVSVERHVMWLRQNRASKHDFRVYPAKAIILDFSRSKFLKPYHIAPLACLIQEYLERGFRVKISDGNTSIQKYLESFGFDDFCKSVENDGFRVSNDRKTFPLWHITESKKEFYTINVQTYFEKNHFSGQDLFVLGNSLAELMNNIFDHAQSKISGYTFTQYNTRSDTIITCVCDFGIGIPTSVNRFLRKINETKLNDEKALVKAFEMSFSTSTKPHNRGFGWDTIFTSLQGLKGKLHVVSNRAVFLLMSNGKIKTSTLNSSFPGTLVVITLDTKYLPSKEELSDELDLF